MTKIPLNYVVAIANNAKQYMKDEDITEFMRFVKRVVEICDKRQERSKNEQFTEQRK